MSHSITLLRHGRSIANRDQIVQGRNDSSLSDEGRVQSRTLATYWAANQIHFNRIISSPLLRARETAEIISEILTLEIEYDEIWTERHLGAAEGEAYETLQEWYKDRPLPTAHESYFDSGEGEWDIFLRAGRAVQSLVFRPQGIYLVVSHSAFLGAVMRAILGLAPRGGRIRPVKFSFDNTGFAVLNYDPEMARWSIEQLNNTCHLDRT